MFLGCAHETLKPRGKAHRNPPRSWKPSEPGFSHCEAPAVLVPATGRSRAWAHRLNATGPGSPAGPGPGRRKPPGATSWVPCPGCGDPGPRSQKTQVTWVSWAQPRRSTGCGEGALFSCQARGAERCGQSAAHQLQWNRWAGPQAHQQRPHRTGPPARDREARLLAGGQAGTGRRPCPLRPHHFPPAWTWATASWQVGATGSQTLVGAGGAARRDEWSPGPVRGVVGVGSPGASLALLGGPAGTCTQEGRSQPPRHAALFSAPCACF